MANKLLFITALHGDEGFSVEIMKSIEHKFEPKEYNYEWIIGNPEAYKKNARFTQGDLNRVAPGNSESKVYEERRASELVDISKNYSAIIDIHGTNANSGVFTLITNPLVENLLLASSLPIQNIVIWPSKSSIEKGPVTQFVNCPAVEIECGPKDQENVHILLEKIIEIILLTKEVSVDKLLTQARQKQFYTVYGKVQNIDTTNFEEFKQIEIEGEKFYPLLIDSYKQGSARKMKKLNLFDLLSY